MPSPNNTTAPSGGARGHCSHHRLPRRKLRLVQVGDFDLIHGSVQVHAKGGHIHKVSLAFSTLTSDVEVYSVGREAREYLLHPKNDLLRPMSGFGVHSWFKRALKAAGLPETIKMHAAPAAHVGRHHRGVLLHPSLDDLTAAIRRMEDSR